MRYRVIGDGQDNDFTTDFDRNETFIGRGGDDSYTIAWFEERDRLFGNAGADELRMDWFIWDEYGGLSALNRAVWFDGGRGQDRIEYRVIYEPKDTVIDLGTYGGTLTSVEHIDFFVTDHQGRTTSDPVVAYDVTGTARSEDIIAAFGFRNTQDLTLRLDAGGGNDRIAVTGGYYDRLVVDGGGGHDTIVVNGLLRDGARNEMTLRGGAGNDRIYYNDPGGVVLGGAGRDTFLLSPISGSDAGDATIYRGGKGADTFVFYNGFFPKGVGADIRDFRGNDRLEIAATIVGSMDAVALTPSTPGRYVEYDPASGILMLSGQEAIRFTPGTIIREDQVSIVDAGIYSDMFFF
ncbi:hypothetical protein [Seohaeicola zhoushanensis]|uniref:Calcium-binding protein n=1 Tax=Seohaeicola zhoushanensis TaxID=1569283 RepID=A0A8J3GX89_9RHOB|nr:hypothetical protein [Seohaeicola zhoushanensis]GHF51335.1 hypothetical protein GCM10017056_23790 [Seohaeicola zhoushanensis]